MESISLNHFVRNALVDKRVRFADLRRLQRDVLPDGPTTREQAEALLALDQVIERADRAWPDYLTSAIKEFVLSGAPAPGSVDRETATWLMAALSCSRPRTALAIARDIVRDAEHVDDVLVTFAERSKRKPKPAHSVVETPQLGFARVSASWPSAVYSAAAISVQGPCRLEIGGP
jgi:hypothetical protein